MEIRRLDDGWFNYIPEDEIDTGTALQCIEAGDERGLLNGADVVVGKPINKGLSRLMLYGAHKILMKDALHNLEEIPPVVGSDSSDEDLLNLMSQVKTRTQGIIDDPS
jgi:hypothetical protein